MEDLINEIQFNATEYLQSMPELSTFEVSKMIVNFAIETFVLIRNYPNSFDDARKLTDIAKHKNKITMAVIEICLKKGAEGEKTHTENGTSRTYDTGGFAKSVFGDVTPFVEFLSL